jgi:GNAT superfamily N-acetyltransferase
MKIYEDSMDQVLLCVGYDFSDDCPMRREVARRQFGSGASIKEWWRYRNVHLGLRTFVAYDGRRPVGHIEIMPIQHAPRPITGTDQTSILCLYVEEHARGQGVGRELIEAAERVASQATSALAVVAREEGEFMPAEFFMHLGYQPVDARAHELLLCKPFDVGLPPRFLPLKFKPSQAEDKLCVDFVHCQQCPISFRALKLLEGYVSRSAAPVELQVIEASEREDIDRFGIAQGVFIQGDLITDDHPMNTDWKQVVKRAIEEMHPLEV